MNRSLTYVCMQTLEQGQAAYTHVFEIIKGLEKRGWVIDLVKPSAKYDTSTSSSGLISKLGIFEKIFDSVTKQVFYFPSRRPEIYYVRFHFLTIFILIKSKLGRIPIVYEINGPFEDLFIAWPIAKRARKFFTYIMEYQLKRSSHIVAVTPQLASWASNLANHQHVSVVPNGANTTIFRKTIATNYRDKYVIFFGTLASWQGVETIVSASRLTIWPSDVRVFIVGDGEMSEAVKKEATINSKILYLGRKDYESLPDLISGAIVSISVQTNARGRANTGLSPLKVYESLACGTPVIVSNFLGTADFIRNVDCGLVIEPSDDVALANAVRVMSENPKLANQMGINGRQSVLLSHSWDARAHTTEEVILNVLQRTKRASYGSAT